MTNNIIAFAGRAGHGKSSAADLWVSRGATRLGFADPLKVMALDLFRFAPVQVFGTQAEKAEIDLRYGRSPRQILQDFGLLVRKHLGEDVWARALVKRARAVKGPVVVDDMRYPNEAEILNAGGARLVKLVCLDAPEAADPNHPSEAGVDLIPEYLWDHVVTWKMAHGPFALSDALRAHGCAPPADI